MNLRFSGGSTRLRISRQELERILERGELRESTALPGEVVVEYGVRVREGGFALEASGTGAGIRVLLVASRGALAELLDRPAAKDLGLYAEGLALEVDLKKK